MKKLEPKRKCESFKDIVETISLTRFNKPYEELLGVEKQVIDRIQRCEDRTLLERMIDGVDECL